MTILITGSSGKTSKRLAALLRTSLPILIASRSGADVDGIPAVRFDWKDPSTYVSPYAHPQAQASPITAIYLVSQTGSTDPFNAMKPFIDEAKAHGVRRFVLLSAIREDETTPGTGKVHGYLKELGVEWTVLRPTWFMENFSEQQHLPTIREQSSIFSATGHGKIPFISTEDIARVASQALLDEKPHNCDYILVGQQLLTHDECAEMFTEILGRRVEHVKLSEDQVVQRFMKHGLPESYARRISGGEVRASQGEFATVNDVVAEVTGQSPLTLRQYMEKNKQAWSPVDS